MATKKFGVWDTIRMQDNGGSLFWAIDGRQVQEKNKGTNGLNPKGHKQIADRTADIDDGTQVIFGVRCAGATAKIVPASGSTDLDLDATAVPAARWKKGGTAMTKNTGQSGRKWNEDLVSPFQAVADPFKATVFAKTGMNPFAPTYIKCKSVTITTET